MFIILLLARPCFYIPTKYLEMVIAAFLQHGLCVYASDYVKSWFFNGFCCDDRKQCMQRSFELVSAVFSAKGINGDVCVFVYFNKKQLTGFEIHCLSAG